MVKLRMLAQRLLKKGSRLLTSKAYPLFAMERSQCDLRSVLLGMYIVASTAETYGVLMVQIETHISRDLGLPVSFQSYIRADHAAGFSCSHKPQCK
jgi:hypothetical protein